MPAHIFPEGLKVSTKVYVDLLEKVVLPWLTKTYPLGTKFMRIQDSAPGHVSKKAVAFLNRNFDVMVQPHQWPSNSPDLNPCDF